MSLWCCAYYTFQFKSNRDLKMSSDAKTLINNLENTRYKIYDSEKNRIVLGCGTDEEVINLLSKSKNDQGNIKVLRGKRIINVATEIDNKFDHEIEVNIICNNFSLSEIQRQYDMTVAKLSELKRLNASFSGKMHLFYMCKGWDDLDKKVFVVGEYGRGYRCVSISGRIRDVEFRDLKDLELLNIRNGKRIGSRPDIPKIEVKDKSWNDMNDKMRIYGSNWYISSDGKITLTDKDKETKIRINKLDGVNKLEISDKDNRVISLMIGTGPKTLGNIGSPYLTKVLLPDTLERILSRALERTSIDSIDLKRCKNLKSISNEVFKSTSGLKELEIPDTVENIGDGIIAYSNVKYLILPRNLEQVNIGMFSFAHRLEVVVLPDKILNISDFYGKIQGKLKNLKEIWVGEDYYESAVNFASILGYKMVVKKKLEIVKVKRKA